MLAVVKHAVDVVFSVTKRISAWRVQFSSTAVVQSSQLSPKLSPKTQLA